MKKINAGRMTGGQGRFECVEPAVASNPLIASVMDLIGLVICFAIAALVI